MSAPGQKKTPQWLIGVVAALVVLPVIGAIAVSILVSVVFTRDEGPDEGSCQSVAVSAGEIRAPEQWRDDLEDAAAVSGVPAEILAAQIHKETGFNETAVNPSSLAAGMAQFMPGTWEQYGQGDPMDGANAIAAQGRYMGALMDLASEAGLKGNAQIEGALAAYNWGDGNMASVGWDWKANAPAETQDYVPFIMGDAQVSFSEDCAARAWDGDLGDGEWTSPLPGSTLISGYGYRDIPGYPEWARDHAGIDLATPGGNGAVIAPMPMRVTAIYAIDGCVLGKATEGPAFGLELCHMDVIDVEVDDELDRGDVIGEEGGTAGNLGGRTTEHLHYAMYDPSGPDPQYPGHQNPVIDPTPLLREKGAL